MLFIYPFYFLFCYPIIYNFIVFSYLILFYYPIIHHFLSYNFSIILLFSIFLHPPTFSSQLRVGRGRKKTKAITRAPFPSLLLVL